MKKISVLIIDDESDIAESLEIILKKRGCRTSVATTGKEGVLKFIEERPAVVICDNALPDTNGIKLLGEFKNIMPEVQVIMITGKGTIDIAVAAMKAGMFDFVTKPFDPEHLIQLVVRASELYFAVKEKDTLKAEIEKIINQEIIGSHPSIKRLIQMVETVAATDSTVLIEGESGTGKELIARMVHKKSHRFSGTFVPVDCGGIPEGLVESELFGHEKGAFTGAVGQKPGKFERADCGTLFLDEIGNLPLSSQAKLLRALQDKVIERVGGRKPIPVDIRLVAATNADLQSAVKKGVFREDLYYRLNVVKLKLPPLRERRSDILELARHFISKHCTKANHPVKDLSNNALKVIMQHSWPGNVRELENVIEHSLVMAKTDMIQQFDLPSFEEERSNSRIDDMERNMLLKAIKESGGNKYRAAKLLGIQRSSLYSKLKKFDISDSELTD